MKEHELNQMIVALEKDEKANHKMSILFQSALNQKMKSDIADFQNRFSRGQYQNK